MQLRGTVFFKLTHYNLIKWYKCHSETSKVVFTLGNLKEHIFPL